MAVDYETVVNTDLSGLDKAASDWKRMGKRFGDLHDNYRDHVKAAVEADGWRGESATTFKSQAQITLEEYAGARDEAQAVGALLEEAHSTLTDRRGKVLEARDQAVEAGMDVNPGTGRCTLNLDRLDAAKAEAYREDPAAREELEERWTKKIRDAVKAVQDADENFRLALAADPDDGNRGLLDGFNGALKDDAGAANAARAEELYDKVGKGEKLSREEREELDLLMRENGADQEFSRTFITSLGGPDGVIRMHNELTDRAYYEDTGQKKHYLGLDRHLANVVATATTVDGKDKAADERFYNTWREQMRKAGVETYDAEVVGGEHSGRQVRGYQSLVTLMRNGDGYDREFLHDLADDIRAAEDPDKGGDPDIWDLDGGFAGTKEKDGTFSPDRNSWFANDPYDGVLGIMSKDPATATAYFDPASEAGEDRLKYLQQERDWDIVNTSEWRKVEVAGPDKADSDSRVGFGAALEAAMTGHVPGEEPRGKNPTHHSEAEVRVLESVVKSYAEAAAVDKTAIPENIRRNMANALAYYPNDVHDILGKNGDFTRDSLSSEPNDVDVRREHMLQFVRGVAEDGGAFRTIHDSQVKLVAGEIHGLGREDLMEGTDRARAVAQVSGQVMGSLDYIRADVLGSQRDDEISQNNWGKVYAYHTIGVPVTAVPVFGDALQRLVDVGTGQYAEQLNDEVSNKTTDELISVYRREGYPRLEEMLHIRAEQVGISEEDLASPEKAFQSMIMNDAGSEYSMALGDAEGAMGDRS